MNTTASKHPKITFVGGGSYNWTPRLLADIMREPSLTDSDIVLLDINATAAEEVAAAGQTMASALGFAGTVRPSTDQEDALRDADIVLITISTGGLAAMAHDVGIPEKYGIFHTVGDSCGPGGWSRALRNIPVFQQLGEAIERLAPQAYVLNYTNPMAVLTATLCQRPLRVVGLCHGIFDTYKVLSRLLGVGESQLSCRGGGVNHFSWVTDFTVDGQQGYPLLHDVLGGRSIDDVLADGQSDAIGFHSHHALLNEFYQQFGYIGYAGDRHSCEFVNGCITPDESALERFRLQRTSMTTRQERLRAARTQVCELASGERRPDERSGEIAVDIIKAVREGQPFVHSMNLPNVGQLDNLPRGIVVETVGMADAYGFRAIAASKIPAVILPLIEPHCRVQALVLEAALNGDHELALQALLLDPLCAHLTSSDVRAMGQELLAATAEWF